MVVVFVIKIQFQVYQLHQSGMSFLCVIMHIQKLNKQVT